MGSKRVHPLSTGSLSKTTKNKLRRQELFVKQKRAKENSRRDERFRRKREEDKDPSMRAERLAKNVPITIDKKRVWDDVDDDGLYSSVNVAELKKRRLNALAEEADKPQENSEGEGEEKDDDRDSMLDFSEEEPGDDEDEDEEENGSRRQRASSAAPSTTSTTQLDLTPDSLAVKFPTLFSSDLPMPKVLITTSLNSTLHETADIFTDLFPNSVFIRRSAHRYAYKYSLREICKYAQARNYTAVVVLKEDQKAVTGLTIVHLSSTGKLIPNHGVAQGFYPELLLNGFSTPLGLLTARSFMSLMPPQPELQGRQVVTFHNQRDYIFLRRHRYVFRDKRESEKSVVGPDGKDVKGVEGLRVGLQEIGPRATLKLRRVDKGVGRAGSDGEDATMWQWKAGMEKKRTRFNL